MKANAYLDFVGPWLAPAASGVIALAVVTIAWHAALSVLRRLTREEVAGVPLVGQVGAVAADLRVQADGVRLGASRGVAHPLGHPSAAIADEDVECRV